MLYASNVRHLCNIFWTWTKFKITASDLFGLHVHNILMCSTFLSEVHGLLVIFALKFPSPGKDLANHAGHHKFWWSVTSDLKLANNVNTLNLPVKIPQCTANNITHWTILKRHHCTHCTAFVRHTIRVWRGGGVKTLWPTKQCRNPQVCAPDWMRYSKWNSGVLFSNDSTLQHCKFKNYTNGPSFFLRLKQQFCYLKCHAWTW
jgi:hypothetical protein